MSERRSWPIVVGGCHRSGTSLVRRILDSHPRIHCGPEIPFFRDFYGNYPDDPLAHLRFMRTVRDLVTEKEALQVLGRAFVQLHEQAARRAGKARWADKAPENVLYTEGWRKLLADRWLFVHVVRNPLDTVASMQGRFPLTLPADIAGKADMYRAFTQAGLDFGAAYPDRYFRLVYEELCSSPARIVEHLADWLGEQFDDRQLAFNDVPHQEGLEDPEVARTDGIHRTSMGRWDSVLDEEDAALVLARTHVVWAAIDPAGRFLESTYRGS
jgi:Sulfotransferase family